MALALDIILVVIFAAFVFTAVKKGFVLSLLELAAVVLSFVLAYSFSPQVAEIAYDGFVKDATIKTIETQIDENISLNVGLTYWLFVDTSAKDTITSIYETISATF